MALHFPGYVPLIENVVYGKDLTAEGVPVQGDVIKGIISLRRFQTVTEDQIYNYLHRKADEADGTVRLLPPDTRLPLRDKSPLENALMAMDPEIRAELIAGKEELERYVRERIPVNNPKPGETLPAFVRVDYGLLPQQLLDANQENIHRDGGKFYRMVMEHPELHRIGFGRQFSVTLELQDSCLPPAERIFPYLQQGVWGMPLLQVNPQRYNRQEVENVMRSFYDAVPSATEVALLEDNTHADVEGTATMVAVEHLVGLRKTEGSRIKIAGGFPGPTRPRGN